jgi:hypothetical protein
VAGFALPRTSFFAIAILADMPRLQPLRPQSKEALLTSAQHKALMLLRETSMLPSQQQSTTGIVIPAWVLRPCYHDASTADHHLLVEVIVQYASEVDILMELDYSMPATKILALCD